MKTILIPGLGYDERIFKHLSLAVSDIEYLNWIEPMKNESLSTYANRLFEQFKHTNEEITLIGHSLGGIVAQEIASTQNIKTIILISSIKSRKEMPLSFKAIKPLYLHKLFTKAIGIQTIQFWGKDHGFETAEDQALFKSMVGHQTNTYLQWALQALSAWNAPFIPNSTQLIQIHGTNDRTFPFKLIQKPDIVIENGSHIVVYKQAAAVSEMINKIIQ